MKYKHEKPFRLLQHYDIDGPLSMALDVQLMQGIQKDPANQPVLRLHRFASPMLTLGNDKQKMSKHLDYDKLIEDNVSVTVRPSAGSASLNHDQELCFTFMTCHRHWVDFGIYEMFETFNRLLCEVFNEIGIRACLVRDLDNSKRTCMDDLEVVTTEGRKLVGSGVMTKPSIYSQEGVIPLKPDFRKVSKYVKDDSRYKSEVFCSREGGLVPTSISEELGEEIEFDMVAGLLVDIFSESYPVELSEFTAEEAKAGRELMEQTYHRAEQWQAL